MAPPTALLVLALTLGDAALDPAGVAAAAPGDAFGCCTLERRSTAPKGDAADDGESPFALALELLPRGKVSGSAADDSFLGEASGGSAIADSLRGSDPRGEGAGDSAPGELLPPLTDERLRALLVGLARNTLLPRARLRIASSACLRFSCCSCCCRARSICFSVAVHAVRNSSKREKMSSNFVGESLLLLSEKNDASS